VASTTVRRSGVSAALWRRPRLRATGTLVGPVLWIVVLYCGSLALLLVTSLWKFETNGFVNEIAKVWNLDNFRTIFTTPTYRTIIVRTILMAAAVTLTDAAVAFPFGFYMGQVASRRTQSILFVLVLIPLWASYLARIYSFQLILNTNGVLNWFLGKVGIGPTSFLYSNVAVYIVLCYVWLPFMIMPVYSAFERIPPSYIEASGDLGARNFMTMRKVVTPLVLPGLVAGSIFTFSLSLGDYITPFLVGGRGSSFIANVVYQNIGIANNLPLAAAFAAVSFAVMAVYLFAARQVGAFEAL
jgi:putative spermidine/putrescine transport system permease protein